MLQSQGWFESNAITAGRSLAFRYGTQEMKTIKEILNEEFAQLTTSRALRLGENDKRPVPEKSLVGLAFSGGGIRSATFNLGILQALAKSQTLRTFDYLSTVSGGGYIGSWLMGWMHHQGIGVKKVEEYLSAHDTLPSKIRERPEVRFLEVTAII